MSTLLTRTRSMLSETCTHLTAKAPRAGCDPHTRTDTESRGRLEMKGLTTALDQDTLVSIPEWTARDRGGEENAKTVTVKTAGHSSSHAARGGLSLSNTRARLQTHPRKRRLPFILDHAH